MPTDAPETYDELTYPNYVFADTHPGRIAANGKFFGIPCCPPESARVLEIGCAGGLNILSQAMGLPGATFVGIDASAEQTKSAQELQALSKIKNVTFSCKRVEDLNASFGRFDYIICHGVFAWVGTEVQTAILRACGELLESNGVAYISYNALPGWHIQKVLRDAMLYHGRETKSPQELLAKGKDFLEFSKDLFPEDAQPLLTPIIDHLLQAPDNYLVHDHLGTINTPLYFHEFTDRCAKHGLMYLADSDLSLMLPKEYPKPVQDAIRTMANGSLSAMEQYCDFLRLRPFRKTLLCRSDCPVQRAITPQNIQGLSVSGKRVANNAEYSCREITSDIDLTVISQVFPRWQTIESLVSMQPDEQRDDFLSALLEQVLMDGVELRFDNCPLASDGAEPAKISPLALTLVPFGRVVPNLRSEAVVLSEELHAKLLDGKKLAGSDFSELVKLGLLRF